MFLLRRFLVWMSSLKVAIFLLILIAIASGIGTAIPQDENKEIYSNLYDKTPWLGTIDSQKILILQLDHIYTSIWFLFLLAWLGISLIVCSWRRQWPSFNTAIQWVDYKDPKQINKLAVAEKILCTNPNNSINTLTDFLEKNGWKVKKRTGRFAARKGIIGKLGPPLVHLGLVLLLIGAVWGSLLGENLENFLKPGDSLELINRNGENELNINLENFHIERDSIGRPEQFRSDLKIEDIKENIVFTKEISVNHPLRYKGLTIYQADWSLESLNLEIDKSPEIKLPLKRFPELGDSIWGIVIPTNPDGSDPILLSISKENGPIRAFDKNGNQIATLRLGEDYKSIRNIPLRVVKINAMSGLLLKRDPGVPIVYASFLIILSGGFLSIISTRKIWAIYDSENQYFHLGGICNRNLTGLSNDLPKLIEIFEKN